MLQNRKREALQANDPLIQCIGELASRYGIAFSPALLDSLARDSAGRLPFHQASAAIELSGLDFDIHDFKKLPKRDADYPAVISLNDSCLLYTSDAADE